MAICGKSTLPKLNEWYCDKEFNPNPKLDDAFKLLCDSCTDKMRTIFQKVSDRANG